MALRNQNRQRAAGQTQQSGQDLQGQQQVATQAGTAFLAPILARVGNEAVTVIAFGDIPGHSPSYLCVDDAGESSWQSMTDVQIIDPKVLPLTAELMGRIQNQQQNGSQLLNR